MAEDASRSTLEISLMGKSLWQQIGVSFPRKTLRSLGNPWKENSMLTGVGSVLEETGLLLAVIEITGLLPAVVRAMGLLTAVPQVMGLFLVITEVLGLLLSVAQVLPNLLYRNLIGKLIFSCLQPCVESTGHTPRHLNTDSQRMLTLLDDRDHPGENT